MYRPTSLPQKLFLILEDPNYNCTAQLVSIVILLLIVLGCITYVMESMRAFQYVPDRCDRFDPRPGECEPRAKPIFFRIEAVCIGVFTVEYVSVSYTHLRAHETREDLVCRLLLEKKKK